MRKINPELLLILFLVAIAAMVNFLVASQRMALMFYFLPTLYSAYRFGQRHATSTACASVALVVLLTYFNPTIFSRQVNLPFDSRWFDLTVWGGVLVVAGYAMGSLYERNQRSLNELKDGYDGMLLILQLFLTSRKFSEEHTYRTAMYATQIAEALGLDPASTEDVRTAALLRNINDLGISNEVLYKAANLSQEELEKGMGKKAKTKAKAQAIGGSLRRVIPILMAGKQLAATGGAAVDAPFEVQVLAVAEKYESLVNADGERKLPPSKAQDIIVRCSGKTYDSMIVDAFVKALGQQAESAGA